MIEPPMTCTGCVCESAPIDRGPRTHPLQNVTDIAADQATICARTADDRVRCSPAVSSLDERLLDAVAHPWSIATPVMVGDVTQVVHGRDHSCALRANGLVACWGDNMFGQLGRGALGLATAPAR